MNLFNLNRSLYEQICAEHNLLDAFLDVKRNHGSPGIDGKTIEEFETNLHAELSSLSKELQEWRYRPKPVRRVEIPKADGKSTRQLGIPCVRDRVVQSCLKRILEPIFEPIFSNHSYGFRPGRSQKQAIKAAHAYVLEGKEWVVDIDLARFYDTICQDRLISRLGESISDKRILRLIGITLRSGVMVSGKVEPTLEGSVQGSPLSPLLSNVVLDELDKELENRGLSFVRWADDSNIFVKSEKAAQRVMQSITKFIEKRLRLQVNREKSQVGLSNKVKFLGMTIIAGTVAISAKSMVKAMAIAKSLTRTNSPIPVVRTMEKVNSWYKGWAQYHTMTQYPSQFLVIEAHIRRRLRARIVRQCKRRRTLFRKLVARGMSRKKARTNVFSAKGPWKLSHQTMNHAYSVKWFTKYVGQEIISDNALQHWFSVKKRILLR